MSPVCEFRHKANGQRMASLLPPTGPMPETVSPEAGGHAAVPLHTQQTLDRSLLTGIAWTGAAKWITQLLSWLSTIVVARLLTREDYGIAAMATLVLGFVQLINEFGIGAAIVQRRDMGEDEIARIGGFALVLGVGFAALAALLGKPVALFFGEPAVAGVMAVLGLTFIASSVRTVPYALLTRELRFKRIAVIETAEGLCLTLFTFGLALAGMGYWALVLGSVGAKTLGSLFAHLARPHPTRLPVPFASIAGAVRFGADVVRARIAWYVYSNADFAIVGRLLGKASLGAYSFGWTLASIPVDRIYALYQRVTGAVIARVQHDQAEVARYLVRITEGIALVSFPASVGLALVAGDFVHVVLGEQWLPAIGPLRFLALASAMRSLDPLLAQLLISTGHAKENARTMTFAVLLMPLLFVAGTRWGPTGVAVAWLAGHPVLVMSQQLHHALRISGVRLTEYARALWPAFSSTALMTAAVLAVMVAARQWPAVVRLAAAVSAGALVYGAVVLTLHRERIRAFRALLGRR